MSSQRPVISARPGHVRILVLDEHGRLLHRVSPEYAGVALARGEVVTTEQEGVVQVVPGGWRDLNGTTRRPARRKP